MREYFYIMFTMSIVVILIAAWLTHIVQCIAVEAWVLLFAGAFIFPVAIVHGIGVWLGAW